MSKNTISFDNFADWHGEVNGVEFRSYMPLPEYVPTSELDVNLGRMATMARIGRLNSVKIGLYDEDQEVSFSVASVSADGSATATGIKTGSVARADSEVSQQPEDSRHKFPQGRGQVKVNAGHPDLDDKILRQSQPWAHLLDKGIKDGLKDAGNYQLTNPRSKRLKFFWGYAGSMAAFGAVGTAISQDPMCMPVAAVSWSAWGVLSPHSDRLANKMTDKTADALETKYGRKFNRKYSQEITESSFVPFWPLDRMLALKVLTKTQSIVTVK